MTEHVNEERFQRMLCYLLGEFKAVYGYEPSVGSPEHGICYHVAEELEDKMLGFMELVRGMVPTSASQLELERKFGCPSKRSIGTMQSSLEPESSEASSPDR